MPRLYELTDDYIMPCAQLDDCDNEQQAQEVMDAIVAIETNIVNKAENYARIILNKAAEAAMYEAEIKRLTGKKKAAEAAQERLKDGIAYAMEIAGAEQIVTPIGVWKKRRNPPSVQILEEADIPEEYLIPQPAKIDKKAILTAYKSTGEIIPGTDIVQKESVTFK